MKPGVQDECGMVNGEWGIVGVGRGGKVRRSGVKGEAERVRGHGIRG